VWCVVCGVWCVVCGVVRCAQGAVWRGAAGRREAAQGAGREPPLPCRGLIVAGAAWRRALRVILSGAPCRAGMPRGAYAHLKKWALALLYLRLMAEG
jgi:hypothetical protein